MKSLAGCDPIRRYTRSADAHAVCTSSLAIKQTVYNMPEASCLFTRHDVTLAPALRMWQ